MITPQHYVVRGLYYIHPDVLHEACIQGEYVATHFAHAIVTVLVVWSVSSYVMYIEGDVWQGALMMIWGTAITFLYMYVILKNLPSVPHTPSPDPGMPYENDNLAGDCEVILLTFVTSIVICM